MKRLVSALASVALLLSPLPAMAQSHGGGFHGGGFHGGGGFRGGFHGGGFHGGFHGFHGRGFFPFFGGFGLGFALAAAPWYYGFPGYWWDWGPPYAYYYGPYGPWDGYYGPPPPDGPPVGPPPAASSAPPAACGSWVWRADQSKYQWVPAPCAPAAPPAGS
jgi:hypothetical protein